METSWKYMNAFAKTDHPEILSFLTDSVLRRERRRRTKRSFLRCVRNAGCEDKAPHFLLDGGQSVRGASARVIRRQKMTALHSAPNLRTSSDVSP